MRRREFLVQTGAAGALAAPSASAAMPKNQIIEMRTFYLRNTQDNQRQRTTDFIRQAHMPALQRAGTGPVGVFSSTVAPHAPFLLVVTSYASLAAMEGALAKLTEDKEYQKAVEGFSTGPNTAYVRSETSLLKAFDSVPAIETPSLENRTSPRLFEVRTYESNSVGSLARKVRMFNEGEIDIFRKVGMLPVFFGETIVGANQPNLTYMLAYDDFAARERTWRAFVGSPEWKKMSSQPGVSDAEIVSNISNMFVSPLPFSAIR